VIAEQKPELPVTLTHSVHHARRGGVWLWECEDCPFCGLSHTHGGGLLTEDPRELLSDRTAHCQPFEKKPAVGHYRLVDADPKGTLKKIAARKAWTARRGASAVQLQRVLGYHGPFGRLYYASQEGDPGKADVRHFQLYLPGSTFGGTPPDKIRVTWEAEPPV
jgi:hypothetical protein